MTFFMTHIYALDRSRCLDIMEVYGVGTRALRLLSR